MSTGGSVSAEKAATPSIISDPLTTTQPAAPEPLFPPPGHLAVDIGTAIPQGQAEISPSEKALLAVHDAEEVMKPIEHVNTVKWRSVVSKIKWVMDTLSSVAEVRTISILPFRARANFRSQLHPYTKMAYELVSKIPEVQFLRWFRNEVLMLCCFFPETPRAI